jgi:TPR repeat protein
VRWWAVQGPVSAARAAENNSLGMASIGNLYENGHGVPADFATARKYEKTAAAWVKRR